MAQAKVKKNINAPADKVWATLSKFSGIEEYMPVIANSATEGKGIGMKRHCTMQDGAELHETLQSLDDQNRQLKYSIDSTTLPIENYMATVKVSEVEGGKSEVIWDSNFDVQGMPEQEAVNMLEGAYAEGIDKLEEMHKE